MPLTREEELELQAIESMEAEQPQASGLTSEGSGGGDRRCW